MGRGRKEYLLKAKKDKRIGEIGEKLVMKYEKNRLVDLGRNDLADSVEHISVTQEDGSGFDIKSYNEDGTDRLIEVKTTKQGIDAEFFMTPNEIEFSELNQKNYFLYRLYDLELHPLNACLYINPGNVLDNFEKEPVEFVIKSN